MIDARGLSSPMPVLMIQKAMKTKADNYEVLVDSEASCESVTKFSKDQGYKVAVEEKNGDFFIKIFQ